MALFGQIGEFVSEEEEWLQYVERLEHYLCANTIDGEDWRRAVFLSTMHSIMCSLLSPVKPGDIAFKALIL